MMTRTEAAEILANDVIVIARRYHIAISKTLAEAQVSELRGPNYAHTCKGEAAAIANPRTVLRIALKESRRSHD